VTTETPRGLTAEQLKMLLTPLQPGRVRQQQGQSHLEAWDVRRWLTRIFGFGGWNEEILTCEVVHSVTSPVGNDPAPLKHRCTAVYRVTLRLTVKDQWGNEIARFEEGATGDSVNQPSVGDAHDMALKTALSQALKRCAINLGDQFGLSLYNKGDTGGVVGRTLGHPVLTAEAPDPEQDAPVVGGELDEQREASPEPQPPAQLQYQVADAVARKVEAEQQGRVRRSRPTAPPSDAWNGGEGTEPPARAPKASTRPQQQKIAILISEKRGNLSRADRLATVVGMIGRQIASSAELTSAEASDLIERLMAEPDLPAGDPADAPGQDFQMAPQVGPSAVCADLIAEMEGATDLDALAEIGARVTTLAERHVLHQAHLDQLDGAWRTAQQRLAEPPANGWSHRLLAEQTGVAA
jgi:hypothetical protein